MIQSINKLLNRTIEATNGTVGKIVDIVFDRDWRLQYLEVDTDPWLPGGRLLLSPKPLCDHQGEGEMLAVNATREEILSRWVHGSRGDNNPFSE